MRNRITVNRNGYAIPGQARDDVKSVTNYLKYITKTDKDYIIIRKLLPY